MIQRADGFIDLRLLPRAKAELEKVPVAYRENRACCDVYLRLAMEEQNWAYAAEIAADLARRFSDELTYPVQLAYCIRRKESLSAARSVLLEASRRFKKAAIIPYNLACYECQLGNREEASKYLQRAIQLDKDCRELAMNDDDLEPMWAMLDDKPGT